MAARIEVAPELIAKGRYLYEQTDTPVDDIAAMFTMSRWTLNGRIRQWGWTRRLYRKGDGVALSAAGPAAMPEAGANAAAAPPIETSLPFGERLRRVIDAQMQVAERTLKVLGPASSAEAERTSRILAMVSRTVQEIKATVEGRADEADNDPVPGDIDEFCFELARCIRGFIETRRHGAGGVSGDPEAPLE